MFCFLNAKMKRFWELRTSRGITITYENPLLAEVVTKKTEIFVSKNDKKILPSSNYLALLAAVGNTNEIRTVMDFGGAAGIHYHLVKPFLPNLESYVVIETEAMVKAQTRNLDEKLRFQIIEDGIDVKRQPDLLYLSSSLSYVENPVGLLSDLLLAKPKSVLISRTAFNEDQGNVSFTQTSKLSSNGPGPLPPGYKDQIVEYQANIPSYKSVIEVLEKEHRIEWICPERESLVGPDKAKYPYVSILARIRK